MARTRVPGVLLAIVALCAFATAQPLPFPHPDFTPESISDTQDFPYIPALPGTRLISTRRINEPLELKQATADGEAMLAGMSYTQKTYDRPGSQTAIVFLSAYRDALFAAGWKLIDVTKIEEIPITPETVTVAARYGTSGRNIYARLSQEPGGRYQISVADVGAEDWRTTLANECRLRLYSIHFDLDRATLLPEATVTLEKAADLLRTRAAPAVEVQGHSDNVGAQGDAARQLLSEARAKAVARWLTTHGVPAAKVTVKGYGKTRPVVDNDSDLGRALNRRIELVVTGPAKCRSKAQ